MREHRPTRFRIYIYTSVYIRYLYLYLCNIYIYTGPTRKAARPSHPHPHPHHTPNNTNKQTNRSFALDFLFLGLGRHDLHVRIWLFFIGYWVLLGLGLIPRFRKPVRWLLDGWFLKVRKGM